MLRLRTWIWAATVFATEEAVQTEFPFDWIRQCFTCLDCLAHVHECWWLFNLGFCLAQAWCTQKYPMLWRTHAAALPPKSLFGRPKMLVSDCSNDNDFKIFDLADTRPRLVNGLHKRGLAVSFSLPLVSANKSWSPQATEMHGADWCEAAGQSERHPERVDHLKPRFSSHLSFGDWKAHNDSAQEPAKGDHLERPCVCKQRRRRAHTCQDYPADISMFKEMVQNADDAGATEAFHWFKMCEPAKQCSGPFLVELVCYWFFWCAFWSFKRCTSCGTGGSIGSFGLGRRPASKRSVWEASRDRQSLLTPDMDRWLLTQWIRLIIQSRDRLVPFWKLWSFLWPRQGPALWIFNNSQFSSKDFDSICRLGVGGKREQQRTRSDLPTKRNHAWDHRFWSIFPFSNGFVGPFFKS